MRSRAPWQDGRRAWERLNGWHNERPDAVPGHPDDGDAALKALQDIHLCHGLLTRAELVSVKTARKHGKSWAEIATYLGTTKEAALGRWGDVDADAAQPTSRETVDG